MASYRNAERFRAERRRERKSTWSLIVEVFSGVRFWAALALDAEKESITGPA